MRPIFPPVHVEIPDDSEPSTSKEFLCAVLTVQEERATEYGKAQGERSFAAIAQMFSAATGIKLEDHHVALILKYLKDVRAYSNLSRVHMDSLIDSVSYTSLWAELFKANVGKAPKE